MAGRGRGGGITPERVVTLLKQAVAESSQVAVANATGLTRLTVQRYLKGIGEPSQATLEKLSDYFGVSVAELRGDLTPRALMENINEYLDQFLPKDQATRDKFFEEVLKTWAKDKSK